MYKCQNTLKLDTRWVETYLKVLLNSKLTKDPIPPGKRKICANMFAPLREHSVYILFSFYANKSKLSRNNQLWDTQTEFTNIAKHYVSSVPEISKYYEARRYKSCAIKFDIGFVFNLISSLLRALWSMISCVNKPLTNIFAKAVEQHESSITEISKHCEARRYENCAINFELGFVFNIVISLLLRALGNMMRYGKYNFMRT